MRVTVRSLFLVIVLLLSSGLPAWAQPSSTVYDRIHVDPFEVITQHVVITKAPAILTQMGESRQIEGAVVGAAGKSTGTTITWASSNPDIVSVTADGQVTAESDSGSATLTGSADGAAQANLIVVVAAPRSGTVIIQEVQILEAPVSISGEQPPERGYLYEVVVDASLDLSPGDEIVGAGLTPVAGRIMDIVDLTEGQLLTVSLVDLDDLFDELQINEEVDLSQSEYVFEEAVTEHFRVIRNSAGPVHLRALPDKSAIGTQAVFLNECESELPSLEGILGAVPTPEPTVDPSLSFKIDFDVNTGLGEMLALGNVNVAFDIKPRLLQAITASVECKARLFRIPIPVGGALSWFFGGFMPVGVGFKLDAGLTFPNLQQIGFDITVAGNASLRAGFECTPYCDVVADLEPPPSFQSTIQPVLPPVGSDLTAFRLGLGGFGFGFADLTLGNPLLKALQFDALSVKAGISQSFDFQSRAGQVEDVNYASLFKLERKLDVSLNNKINMLLAKIGVNLPDFLLVEADVLAHSPKGSLIIRSPDGGSSDNPSQPATVKPGSDSELGELATFEVTLDPVTYLGVDSVRAIDLYRQTQGPQGEIVLTPNRSPCATLFPQSPGQKTFSCTADFLEEDVGTHSIVAFVRAELFGFEIPIPLEIKPDSRATLYVSQDGPPIVTSAAVWFSAGCGGSVSVKNYDADGESEYESEDYTGGGGPGQGQHPTALVDQPGGASLEDGTSLNITLGAGSASISCSATSTVALYIYTVPGDSPSGTVVAEIAGSASTQVTANASANPSCEKGGNNENCARADARVSGGGFARVEYVNSGALLNYRYVKSDGTIETGPWDYNDVGFNIAAFQDDDSRDGPTPGGTPSANGSFSLTLHVR